MPLRDESSRFSEQEEQQAEDDREGVGERPVEVQRPSTRCESVHQMNERLLDASLERHPDSSAMAIALRHGLLENGEPPVQAAIEQSKEHAERFLVLLGLTQGEVDDASGVGSRAIGDAKGGAVDRHRPSQPAMGIAGFQSNQPSEIVLPPADRDGGDRNAVRLEGPDNSLPHGAGHYPEANALEKRHGESIEHPPRGARRPYRPQSRLKQRACAGGP